MPTTVLLSPSRYRVELTQDWEAPHRLGCAANKWDVVREVPATKLERVASCDTQVDAERIVVLLNGGQQHD